MNSVLQSFNTMVFTKFLNSMLTLRYKINREALDYSRQLGRKHWNDFRKNHLNFFGMPEEIRLASIKSLKNQYSAVGFYVNSKDEVVDTYHLWDKKSMPFADEWATTPFDADKRRALIYFYDICETCFDEGHVRCAPVMSGKGAV